MEATANQNRTNSNNSGAMDAVMKMTDLGSIEFYYQFCNNPHCREITAFILPLNRKAGKMDKDIFQKIVQDANIPALILEYPNQDSKEVTVHSVSKRGVFEATMTWERAIRFLASLQLKHEKASSDSECGNYTHQWLPRGKWKNAKDNYRFSNEARTIPGVRHVDTDGVLYCLDCCAPIYVVEATSDGTPGTHLSHKRKSTYMTQRLSDMLGAQPVLVQHSVNDKDLKNPVYLTTWGKNREIKTQMSGAYFSGWLEFNKDHTCF